MLSAAMDSERCPICYAQAYTPFFELCAVPVQDGMLWRSKEAALNAPTGDIKLAFCHCCGYVGNLRFNPQKIRYDQEYSFSLHFSPTYQTFVNTLATRLMAKFALTDQPILEIGCGQGDFIRLLCQLGCSCGIGIDPTVTPHCEQIGASLVTFIQDWYTEQHTMLDAHFICCRHLLDQIANPRAFVELVRRNIGQRAETVLYWEVPNAANIFEDLLVRNIIYEKSSWFTVHSLLTLFERAGFRVLAVEPCFEGNQYLGIEAMPITGRMSTSRNGARSTNQHDTNGAYTWGSQGNTVEQFSQSVMAFSANYQQKMACWRRQVAAIRQTGQRALAWGAGSGAITFLNMLKIKEEIPYVIDINPKRQGMFLPLTGQQVVAPAFLTEYRPDVIIITNATYTEEIKQQVGELGIQCEFMVV